MEIKAGEHTTIEDGSVSGTQPLKDVTWIKTDNPLMGFSPKGVLGTLAEIRQLLWAVWLVGGEERE